jgi:hypothetical protein
MASVMICLMFLPPSLSVMKEFICVVRIPMAGCHHQDRMGHKLNVGDISCWGPGIHHIQKRSYQKLIMQIWVWSVSGHYNLCFIYWNFILNVNNFLKMALHRKELVPVYDKIQVWLSSVTFIWNIFQYDDV